MLLALQGTAVVAGSVSQLFGVDSRVVGQRILFEVTPGVFDGIQFRCVGRQEDGVNRAGIAQKCHDGLGPMGAEPVPDEHDGMRIELLAKLAQERDD